MAKRLDSASTTLRARAIVRRGFAGLTLIALVGCAHKSPSTVAWPVHGRYPLVPAKPPEGLSDSVWAVVGDSSNMFWNEGGFAGPVVKNTLIAQFVATATQAQKQAIVDAVPAKVIGGVFGRDYYLEFTDPTPVNPDSAAHKLMRRLDSLRANPLVANVFVHVVNPLQEVRSKPIE